MSNCYSYTPRKEPRVIDPINIAGNAEVKTCVAFGEDNYCVYVHFDLDNRVFWVDWDTLAEALNSKKAALNERWRQIVAASSGVYVVQIVARYPDKVSAMRYAAAVRAGMNVTTTYYGRFKDRRVTCISTGVEYDSASSAARAFGISRSAMSMHLNGKKGYATVHGLVFKYVNDAGA